MAETSDIEWTDATWNPITGCSVVSPGCTNCYAMRLAGTRLKNHHSRQGLTTLTKAGPVWNGLVRFNEDWLDQPLRWTRPRRIFVCAHGDLFHEDVPDAWIDQVFAVMALSPRHTYQVLTKRTKRMREYFAKLAQEAEAADERTDLCPTRIDDAAADLTVTHGGALEEVAWPLPNVWLGVSAEDQTRADDRIPQLLATPAAVRFVSLEPLLGAIDLKSSKGGTLWIGGQRGCDGTHHGVGTPECPRERHHHHDDRCRKGLDWVIIGGESQHGSRPMHPDWARDLRDQCVVAGVPFFFKQWGDWLPEGQFDKDGFQWAPGSKGKSRTHWWLPEPAEGEPLADAHCSVGTGSGRAGRTLDGRTWDQMPNPANPVRGRAA